MEKLVIKDSLGEVERVLEDARDARRQLEHEELTGGDHGGSDDARGTLRSSLKNAYEILSLVLEAGGLIETRLIYGLEPARVMKLLRTLVWISVLVIMASTLLSAQTAFPNSPPGWKTYVDRVHGFSFAYPPIYKRMRRPDISDSRDDQINKAAAEGRWVGLLHQRSDARIDFILENKSFDLNSFVRDAPTGYEDPPAPVREGDSTFYVYGPGGGGVDYPDQFFFNLRGKTLYIVFDGPYIDDKTPGDETKKIETKILASLRTF